MTIHDSDKPDLVVFEVIERRRGVTQQDPDELISHGLYGNRYRADKKTARAAQDGCDDHGVRAT